MGGKGSGRWPYSTSMDSRLLNHVPFERKVDFNRTVAALNVSDYCDWVLAGRPGLTNIEPHLVRRFMNQST
jgi:hypothetical protein